MGLNRSIVNLSLSILLLTGALSAAPKLRLSTTAVGPVSVAVGGTVNVPPVNAANAGDGNLSLRVSSSVPWIVPTVGAARPCSLAGNSCLPIQMAIQPGTLQRGTYTGVVTVTDPNAIDAPQTITVTLQVGGGVPDRLDLFVAPNGTPAEATFTTNAPLTTSVTTQNNVPFLSVALEGAGSFRFTYPYRVTGTHTAGLNEGSYTGSIVTSGSSLAAENKTVPVSLRVTSQPIAQLGSTALNLRIASNSAKQSNFVQVTNRGQGTLNISGVTTATTSGGSGWLTAERLANTNFVSVSANPAGLNAGTYQGTVTIASNAVNGPLNVPVTLEVFAPTAPVAYYQGVVNNATFAADDVLARGAIVAVFGEQFTSGEPRQASALPLTNDLGGTRVLLNDLPVPVYYVSYGQINFQIPYNAAIGDGVIRVEREGQRGNPVSVQIVEAAPRILQLGSTPYALAVNQDGSYPIPPLAGVNSRPARPGETLVIYAIGVGPTTPAVQSGVASPGDTLARSNAVSHVTFGGGVFGESPIEVVPIFVGLTPGFVGLYQINATIPENAPVGNEVALQFIGPNGASNRMLVAIQP